MVRAGWLGLGWLGMVGMGLALGWPSGQARLGRAAWFPGLAVPHFLGKPSYLYEKKKRGICLYEDNIDNTKMISWYRKALTQSVDAIRVLFYILRRHPPSNWVMPHLFLLSLSLSLYIYIHVLNVLLNIPPHAMACMFRTM